MKRVGLAMAMFLMAGSAMAAQGPNGLIVLLTDYGSDSVYVGALKGAIYSKYPEARIDSITHAIPPFDITTGAFMLMETCKEFPAGTTFCAIVDPGVGTARKGAVLRTQSGHYFIGPDNGLLWLVAQRMGIAELYECSNRALWREGQLSHTFHGRDIFGPVSAAVAKGTPLSEVGGKLDKLTALPLSASTSEPGKVTGESIWNDPYGNIITNISFEDLDKAGFQENEVVTVTLDQSTFDAPLKKTYSDVPEGERLGVIQSLGFLEFAINMGSLADQLKAGAHAKITVVKKVK